MQFGENGRDFFGLPYLHGCEHGVAEGDRNVLEMDSTLLVEDIDDLLVILFRTDYQDIFIFWSIRTPLPQCD